MSDPLPSRPAPSAPVSETTSAGASSPETGWSGLGHPRVDGSLLDLLASYSRIGGFNDNDRHNLPSKRMVAQVCEGLLQLLFPGFHDDGSVSSASLRRLTEQRFYRVIYLLQEEVRKSVRIGDPKVPTGRTTPIIEAFAASLGQVRALLRTDVEAAYHADPSALSREEVILSYPFVEAIAIQRLAHRLYLAGVPLVPRMMTEWAHARTGIDIHPGARIGGHFFIDHGTGVVIGETCVIGEHVRIYHGVTLGARSFVKDESGSLVKGGKRHPDVGDHVTIYPNSTILGGGTVIGANSTIGANVFLLHSVPPDSLVVYEERQLSILNKRLRLAGESGWDPGL